MKRQDKFHALSPEEQDKEMENMRKKLTEDVNYYCDLCEEVNTAYDPIIERLEKISKLL